MGSRTTGIGSFPPINIFQQADDFVVIRSPGVDKNDLGIEVKENTIRISGRNGKFR
jgi:HSP20 family molecular chaperone IbpA